MSERGRPPWDGAVVPNFRERQGALSRRLFLAGTGVVAAGAILDAFLVEPNWLQVTRHDVPVAKLPRQLDGFTIAQITDAHLSRIGTVEESIIRTIQTQDVQLVALTGDIVDSNASLGLLREFGSNLKKAGTEVVATLGNWEHWGQVQIGGLVATYADFGAKLLMNEATTVTDGVRAFATDDSTAGTPELQLLHRAEKAADVTVLLTHSPAFLDHAALSKYSFGLALAGHTHGGQLRLGRGAIPFLPPGSGRFTSGWYDTQAGRAYVSRGTGTSIIPARFTCRPELAIFRLRQG